MIGPWQLVLILVIIFILFGAGKLPRVMGDVGKGVKSLRDGLSGSDSASNAQEIDPQETQQASKSNDQHGA